MFKFFMELIEPLLYMYIMTNRTSVGFKVGYRIDSGYGKTLVIM